LVILAEFSCTDLLGLKIPRPPNLIGKATLRVVGRMEVELEQLQKIIWLEPKSGQVMYCSG